MPTLFGFCLYILGSLFVVVPLGVLLTPFVRPAIRLYCRWISRLSQYSS